MQKNWNIQPSVPQELLDKYPDHHRVILQLLYNRGITEEEEIKDFLFPELERLHDPYLLKDMSAAVERIIDNIKQGKKILIYGDYDADGITSCALLFNLLNKLKAEVEVYIPDRVSEGYSLNEEAIDRFYGQGVDLIITVDNGIRNQQEIEKAKQSGMEVIVTDHHIPNEEELPDCLILNPHLSREEYPCEQLAGVGVAYKLVQALIVRSTLSGREKDILTKTGLDLVALGTVADCVPLVDENRILVKQGLDILNHTRRPGLRSLIEVAGLNNNKGKDLQSWNIGFQLAPRLNAAGRIGRVTDAVHLLLTTDTREAKKFSAELDKKNTERQQITEDIVDSIKEDIDKGNIDTENVIVAVNHTEDQWSEGVIGLVAGRISQKFYRPTLVITRTPYGYKGSGRSIEGFDIIDAVSRCGDLLDKFGGHAMACGLSVSESNLKEFQEKIKEIGEEELKDKELTPSLNVDIEMDLGEVDEGLVEKVETLAPFGEGNPAPLFVSRDVCIKDIATMGNNGQHVKFRFNGFWALAFGKAEEWRDYKIGDRVDILYSVEFNNFNGNMDVQLKLVDIQ